MRIGQIGEISTVWAQMGSSSSPGASLQAATLSDASRNYSESLKPAVNKNSALSSDKSPLEALAMKGIRPNFEGMPVQALVPATAAPAPKALVAASSSDAKAAVQEASSSSSSKASQSSSSSGKSASSSSKA